MRKFLALISFIILFVLSQKNVYAYFVDSFDGDHLNNAVWEMYENSGSINVRDGKLQYFSSIEKSNTSPYIRSISQIFPDSGAYNVEINYRFTAADGFGSGIMFSYGPSPSNGRSHTPPITYLFTAWQSDQEGLGIFTWICPNKIEICPFPTQIRDLGKKNFENHKIVITQNNDGGYKLFIDGEKEPAFISGSINQRLQSVWLGNPEITYTYEKWSSLEIDQIKILIDQPRIPIPIFIVPGLGTSWDIGSLINGNSGGNWEVPKFVDLYDSLIKSIENNGYEREKDLFVFGYDWRKTLDSLADDLDIYLKTKLDDGEKAILVGHSMGGMVARAYAQKYGSEKIDKLVTLGSPHKGVLEAYSAWEGATVWGDIWWEKAALELAIHLNNRGGQSRVDTLRSQAPSIKDLLPTYDYLNKNGSIIPWSQTVQKNEYVTNLNRDIGELDSLTKIFAGVSGQTKEILKVINRTDADRLLNRWEDGRPISDNPFIFGAGDGTVTRTSAVGPFSSIREINRWHNELVYERDSIEAVISELGLDPSKVEIIEPDTRSDVLAIILRSPGKLLVCNVSENACGDELGLNIPAYKLFLLPGYNGEKISVRVLEEGQGKYDLHVGYIANDEDWEVIKGNIEGQNQTDRYYLEGKENEISINLDEETRNRNELIVSGNLSVFSPNWDKKGYFNQARDSRINPKIRIKYIKLLRTVLRGEFKKAIKQNNFDYLEAVNNVWKANDRLAYVILAGESVVRERVVDSYFGRVNKFSETVLKRMAKSKGVMPTHTYEFAMEKLDEIGQITTNNTDLRSDQLMSAEYLLYSVLDSL